MAHQHDSAAVKRGARNRSAPFPSLIDCGRQSLMPVLDHHQVAGLFIELREKQPPAVAGHGHAADSSPAQVFPTRNSPEVGFGEVTWTCCRQTAD